ncbi:RSP_7527 family protein [Neptuniibacter halophilus]|uniref:RSP_7527 family protein n=1 Tax=Neptuniibacter halophilus TaxID=651666 RepID=UPI00257358E3|nr:hypothetical protein [Neptuniibacter halophilus]
MNEERFDDVRLDAFGNVDTAYYIAQAKQQRGEVFAAIFRGLVKAVKSPLSAFSFVRQVRPAYSN